MIKLMNSNMKETVLDEYVREYFSNQDYMNYDKMYRFEYGRKYFIIEILLGLIVIITYLLLFTFKAFDKFSWGALFVMLIIELFLVASAFKKKKRKPFTVSVDGIKKDNRYIGWSDITSIRRLSLFYSGTANSKMEVLRITTSSG